MLGIFGLTAFGILGAIGVAVLGAAVGLLLGVHREAASGMIPADAVRVSPRQAPRLYRIVEALAQRAELSRTPELYVSQNATLNAAAFGSDKNPNLMATIALLQSLSERELAGVLAHEMSHIRHNDLLVFRVADLIRTLTSGIAKGFWLLVILYFPIFLLTGFSVSMQTVLLLLAAPLVSVLLQLALLRVREYHADLRAVQLTGDPDGLAFALHRIDYASRSLFDQLLPIPRRNQSTLLRTHPPTEHRVKLLRSLPSGSVGT
jgi:heat shock protein HtpX